jgi:hypothetical protein
MSSQPSPIVATLTPLRGLPIFYLTHPRLAPWAEFFRRFAAGLATQNKTAPSRSRKHLRVLKIEGIDFPGADVAGEQEGLAWGEASPCAGAELTREFSNLAQIGDFLHGGGK